MDRKKFCKPCKPKNCPILYGLFMEKDTMGSMGDSMKAKLLHWFDVGMKIKTLKKEKLC